MGGEERMFVSVLLFSDKGYNVLEVWREISSKGAIGYLCKMKGSYVLFLEHEDDRHKRNMLQDTKIGSAGERGLIKFTHIGEMPGEAGDSEVLKLVDLSAECKGVVNETNVRAFLDIYAAMITTMHIPRIMDIFKLVFTSCLFEEWLNIKSENFSMQNTSA